MIRPYSGYSNVRAVGSIVRQDCTVQPAGLGFWKPFEKPFTAADERAPVRDAERVTMSFWERRRSRRERKKCVCVRVATLTPSEVVLVANVRSCVFNVCDVRARARARACVHVCAGAV